MYLYINMPKSLQEKVTEMVATFTLVNQSMETIQDKNAQLLRIATSSEFDTVMSRSKTEAKNVAEELSNQDEYFLKIKEYIENTIDAELKDYDNDLRDSIIDLQTAFNTIAENVTRLCDNVDSFQLASNITMRDAQGETYETITSVTDFLQSDPTKSLEKKLAGKSGVFREISERIKAKQTEADSKDLPCAESIKVVQAVNSKFIDRYETYKIYPFYFDSMGIPTMLTLQQNSDLRARSKALTQEIKQTQALIVNKIEQEMAYIGEMVQVEKIRNSSGAIVIENAFNSLTSKTERCIKIIDDFLTNIQTSPFYKRSQLVDIIYSTIDQLVIRFQIMERGYSTIAATFARQILSETQRKSSQNIEFEQLGGMGDSTFTFIPDTQYFTAEDLFCEFYNQKVKPNDFGNEDFLIHLKRFCAENLKGTTEFARRGKTFTTASQVYDASTGGIRSNYKQLLQDIYDGVIAIPNSPQDLCPMPLFDYQVTLPLLLASTVSKVADASDKQRLLILADTGYGKTNMISYIAESLASNKILYEEAHKIFVFGSPTNMTEIYKQYCTKYRKIGDNTTDKRAHIYDDDRFDDNLRPQIDSTSGEALFELRVALMNMFTYKETIFVGYETPYTHTNVDGRISSMTFFEFIGNSTYMQGYIQATHNGNGLQKTNFMDEKTTKHEEKLKWVWRFGDTPRNADTCKEQLNYINKLCSSWTWNIGKVSGVGYAGIRELYAILTAYKTYQMTCDIWNSTDPNAAQNIENLRKEFGSTIRNIYKSNATKPAFNNMLTFAIDSLMQSSITTTDLLTAYAQKKTRIGQLCATLNTVYGVGKFGRIGATGTFEPVRNIDSALNIQLASKVISPPMYNSDGVMDTDDASLLDSTDWDNEIARVERENTSHANIFFAPFDSKYMEGFLHIMEQGASESFSVIIDEIDELIDGVDNGTVNMTLPLRNRFFTAIDKAKFGVGLTATIGNLLKQESHQAIRNFLCPDGKDINERIASLPDDVVLSTINLSGYFQTYYGIPQYKNRADKAIGDPINKKTVNGITTEPRLVISNAYEEYKLNTSYGSSRTTTLTNNSVLVPLDNELFKKTKNYFMQQMQSPQLLSVLTTGMVKELHSLAGLENTNVGDDDDMELEIVSDPALDQSNGYLIHSTINVPGFIEQLGESHAVYFLEKSLRDINADEMKKYATQEKALTVENFPEKTSCICFVSAEKYGRGTDFQNFRSMCMIGTKFYLSKSIASPSGNNDIVSAGTILKQMIGRIRRIYSQVNFDFKGVVYTWLVEPDENSAADQIKAFSINTTLKQFGNTPSSIMLAWLLINGGVGANNLSKALLIFNGAMTKDSNKKQRRAISDLSSSRSEVALYQMMSQSLLQFFDLRL